MSEVRHRNRRRHARRRGGLALLAALCAAAEPASAGYRTAGNVSLSLGGSVAYSANVNRKSDDAYDYEYRNGEVYTRPQPGEDYSDTDLSLYLSAGYFILDRVDIGLSSSVMNTRYSSASREDFSVVDAQIYARRYFENRSHLTPYLKAQGGLSLLSNGDYRESNAVFGGVGGLEFFGVGPVTWFAELSSVCTLYHGDVAGSRWRNQLYVGVSWYFDLRRPAAPPPAAALPAAEAPAAAPRGLPPAWQKALEEADRRWQKAFDRLDRAAREAAAGR